MLWYDETNNVMNVYNGGGWQLASSAVNGTFELANTYTKAEIDAKNDLKADQATAYTKTEVDDIILNIEPVRTPYGLIWNQNTDVYTRTGDENYIQVQSLMKRCVLNADGSINYYLHAEDSTLKADGSAAVLDGTDGNVMVQIPKFYYKYNYNTTDGVQHEHSISAIPEVGYTVHPAFVRDGVELDYRYFGAYQGCTIGGKLVSVSGQYPTTNKTITALRLEAEQNGVGWHQVDWLLYEAITLLAIIEYGTMNIQEALGQGRTMLSAGSWANGSYYGISGLSNSLGNASGHNSYTGDADNVEADSAFMSYRGCESFYGNVWTFADGVLFSSNVPYVNQKPSTYDSTVLTADDVSTGVTMTASDGYARELGDSSNGFFPTSVTSGSSAVGTTDYFYANDAGELGIALVGGGAGELLLAAGPLYLNTRVAAGVGVGISAVVSR
jgi:hypothetical protein